MNVEQIGRFLKAQPFRPFVIHLADGRDVPVSHREFVMPSLSGRTLSVYPPDDTLNVIDLLLVTDLEVKPTTGAPAWRRRR